MAIFGTVVLWVLAGVGLLAVIGIGIAIVEDIKKKPEASAAEAAEPPVQITNLRTLPRSDPEVDTNQPRVLQNTTMQITTTKYIDPNASPPKQLSA